MDERFLGDSYDLVKRFWAESLHPIGELYADGKFIPEKLREKFIQLTTMQFFDRSEKVRVSRFGLFLDPNTGISMPNASGQQTNLKHASLSYIVESFKKDSPTYLICFDQSHHRDRDLPKADQRKLKRSFLRKNGLDSFYYVSHAPFLFVSGDADTLESIRERLISIGIPACRFETESE